MQLDEEMSDRKKAHGPVGPFHHAYTVAVQVLVQSEVSHLIDIGQAIEIDVVQRQTSCMLVDDDEGLTFDSLSDTETECDALRQAGLSCTQIPDKQHDIATTCQVTEYSAYLRSVIGAPADQSEALHSG
jgi:hypothetical protein